MASCPAWLDRWWNSVSLRAKITGVTVLLIAFGLTAAGVGTTTVLAGYLLERVDAELTEEYLSLPDYFPIEAINGVDAVDSGNTPFYIAAVTGTGALIDDNLDGADWELRPKLDHLDFEAVRGLNGAITLTSEDGSTRWRAYAIPLRVDTGGARQTLVIGLSLATQDALIARYSLIYFLFGLAVILFGAAATQLLVTGAFAPLRDVEATAARFANGDYAQRLGGATPNTEVGRLNRSLNTMLARIDRAFEDQERAEAQLRRFIGDASHELRTPLVSVRGYAELYRMGALTDAAAVAQAMDRIEREAIRMGRLVEDLLELARLDESRPLDLAPVDLLPVAQDAALDAAASAPNRQVRVVLVEPNDSTDAATPLDAAVAQGHVPGRPTEPATADPSAEPSAEPTVGRRRTVWRSGTTRPAAVKARPARGGNVLSGLGRRGRHRVVSAGVEVTPVAMAPDQGPVVLAMDDKLRQVVTNLLGNAMRFTPDDSPIELEVGVDRQGGFGQIAIVDHGPGIPPQLREKIFERFWRADTSRTRETGGSGLGLAIVAGIVANHHGHVEVYETPGGGATFRVSFPLAPQPVEGDSSPSPEQPSDADGPAT